jgi:dihydroneopterin aldolase
VNGPGRDTVEVRGLKVWAHVGVLELERLHGQWFRLEFRLRSDLSAAAQGDDLSLSQDYGLAIQALQRQARTIRCLTIEHYSERILDLLEELYGPLAMEVQLTKCRAPVAGFSGEVAVSRSRRWS